MKWIHPATWTGIALTAPRAATAAIVLVTVVAALGAVRVETAVGYRAFLGAHHPAVRDLDDFVRRFGGGLPLLTVWSCDVSDGCEHALDDTSLAMADDVARRLTALDSVLEVDSPATTPVLARQAIGFPEMRHLVRNGSLATDIDNLRAQALEDPSWIGRIVSADGKAAAMVVHLRDSASDTATEVYTAVRAAVAEYEARGFEFYFVGGPVEFVVAGADLERSSRRIIPVMVVLIAVALALLFGSPAAATVALASVGLAILWTIGLMGWLGWEQNSLTQILPPLVLVVGVCDAIHLLGRYAGLDDGHTARDAIAAAASEVGAPCAITSATTIAGFGSLAVSGLESIARFGVLAGAAVAAALVLTFVAIPVVVSRLPRSWFVVHGYGKGWSRSLSTVADFATGPARRWIVAISLAAGFAGAIGTAGLTVDATFEDLYGRDSEVVRWVAQTAERLRAPETIEIELTPPSDSGGIDAAGLAAAAAVQEWADGREELGRSLSVVDVMRRLNRLLHRDSLPLGHPADDKGRPASIYRLLRNRDPSVTDELVDPRRHSLRISIETVKAPQRELRELIADAYTNAEKALPAGWSVKVTGPAVVVSHMIDAIRETQLRSFALAAVVVFAMVGLFFRSLPLAALAMVPTLLPIAVTLGVMSRLAIALDVGTAMVATIVLGLAVDDAVHLISPYAAARKRGETPSSAARTAVMTTGRAVTATSLALAVGFLTLGLSSWSSIAGFGVIAAIAVLCALLSALFVLPALASIPTKLATDEHR